MYETVVDYYIGDDLPNELLKNQLIFDLVIFTILVMKYRLIKMIQRYLRFKIKVKPISVRIKLV